uniref:G-protein coupled receptors family 1 profile domain-containing protein n=1 Tax=Panagrolaimus sp. PS1159 TaxID=55785 RepID=A0AC35G212_9BILA
MELNDTTDFEEDYSQNLFLSNNNNNSEFSEPTQVMLVYPPTQEPSLRRLLITMYLIVCLTVGICGNFSQLALQYYSYRLRVYSSGVSPNCTQLYICFLHIVYFLISISLPSVIIENLVQIWMFGMFTCASHLLLVTMGRAAGAWLTVMLFVDQKFMIQKSKISFPRQRQNFYTSLLFIAFACFISALPSIIYIELNQEVLHEEYVQNMILKIRTFKCSAKLPPNISFITSSLTLCVDYLLPLSIIIVLSIQLYWNSRRHPADSIVNQDKLQNYRLIVALLYFIAYCPHWIAVIWLFVGNPTESQSAIIGDLAILFPYTLPAIIWLPLNCLSSAASSQARFYEISISRAEPLTTDPASYYSMREKRTVTRYCSTDLVARKNLKSIMPSISANCALLDSEQNISPCTSRRTSLIIQEDINMYRNNIQPSSNILQTDNENEEYLNDQTV